MTSANTIFTIWPLALNPAGGEQPDNPALGKSGDPAHVRLKPVRVRDYKDVIVNSCNAYINL